MTIFSQITDEIRWQKVLAHDKASDGAFVYAVHTTGIYCRPSCPSRRGKRENVTFFQLVAEAERAGYRPCIRCKPHLSLTLHAQSRQHHADIVARACAFIENAVEIPTLDEIAQAVQTSPAHLHRVFKSMTGLTPKGFAGAKRAERMRSKLRTGKPSVTEAIYDAGFSSSSRFYAVSNDIIGMKPKTYRSGGEREKIRFAIAQSTLGAILVAQSAKGICAILMGDEPQELIIDLESRFPKAELIGADHAFEKLVAHVIGLIENPQTSIELPLDLRGTVFQARVWQALREIPPGETLSYSALASKIGLPNSVRAVASACGANKLAVAVPCHRVVRRDGALSGYRWGVERKRVLLEKERKG